MSHLSPAVTLVWAVSSTLLGSFLVFHLWSFDRFKCLRWNHGPGSGAFRRVMTYSYLLSVPLFIIFSVGFASLKYAYGFTDLPEYGIVPTPIELWSETTQKVIFPLFLCFSVSWGFEIVTHLEELCFWLFFIRSSSAHQDWFQSLYFKIWAVGSCIGVVAMPLTTILARENMPKSETFTFLAGGLGSLLLTLCFLPVLWAFPSFIDDLRQLEVGSHTLARLTRYHELNCIRVVFRFLFALSFIVLGVDGVRTHHSIDNKMLPTDFLGIVGAVGCTVSSGITLVIFFPRSLQGEMARRDQRRRRGAPRSKTWGPKTTTRADEETGSSTRLDRSASPGMSDEVLSYMSITQSKMEATEALSVPVPLPVSAPKVAFHGDDLTGGLPAYEVVVGRGDGRVSSNVTGKAKDMVAATAEKRGEEDEEQAWIAARRNGSLSLHPNRRNNQTGDIELGGMLSLTEVEQRRALRRPSTKWSRNWNRDNRDRRGDQGQGEGWPRWSVSELVRHWRSPIDIGRPTAPPQWQR